jgi:hypothetical protein
MGGGGFDVRGKGSGHGQTPGQWLKQKGRVKERGLALILGADFTAFMTMLHHSHAAAPLLLSGSGDGGRA